MADDQPALDLRQSLLRDWSLTTKLYVARGIIFTEIGFIAWIEHAGAVVTDWFNQSMRQAIMTAQC
jgi:hypothetical protein